MRVSGNIAAIVALVAAAIGNAQADTPMGPPQDYEVSSRNGQWIARMTVEPATTAVYKAPGDGAAVWSIESYHRVVYLADDGEHLAIAFLDLLFASPDMVVMTPDYRAEFDAKNRRDPISDPWSPAAYSPEMVVLRFMRRGEIVRDVSVRELLPDLSKLQRTASSWHWGMFGGFNKRGEFMAGAVDYRTLFFEPATARIVRTEFRYAERVRDFLISQSNTRLAAYAAIIGVIVGVSFRSRTRAAIFCAAGISSLILCVHLWVFGTFRIWAEYGLGDLESTSGSYAFVRETALLYLVPCTVTAAGVSLLWTLAVRLLTHPSAGAGLAARKQDRLSPARRVTVSMKSALPAPAVRAVGAERVAAADRFGTSRERRRCAKHRQSSA